MYPSGKEGKNMTVFEELKRRGLIAQMTDEKEIEELINAGKATFYIGFDPTADSLHVGHFMALCLMKRLQMAHRATLSKNRNDTERTGSINRG